MKIRVKIEAKDSWFQILTNTYTGILSDEGKPAILAALLKEAGAVKVEVEGGFGPIWGGWNKVRRKHSNLPILSGGRGLFWLLPIPEDTP